MPETVGSWRGGLENAKKITSSGEKSGLSGLGPKILKNK